MASTNDVNAPKAHLNYLFFDSRFNLISGSSGAVQVVSGATSWQHLTPVPIPNPGNPVCSTCILTPSQGNGGVIIAPPSPGFLVVYIDNQSIGKDVYFDHLMVEHYTSEVLEENHYYPFGLTVTANPNTSVTPQPYKLTTKELESHFDLNSYDFGARMYDEDGSIWYTPDPLAEKHYNISPYAYCGNNPVNRIDPTGMTDDVYYDYGGHYMGDDGSGDNIRLIRNDDYNNTTAGGSAADNKDKLRGESKVVTVQDDQQFFINNSYNAGETDHLETNYFIILNTSNATLGFEAGNSGTNTSSSASVQYDNNPGVRPNGLTPNDATVPGDSHKVIVGEMHPHPTPTNGNTLVEGVSVTDNSKGGNDLKTAKGINAPVYAVDKNYIHKVDQNGTVTNKQPKDTEILKDALKTKGGGK